MYKLFHIIGGWGQHRTGNSLPRWKGPQWNGLRYKFSNNWEKLLSSNDTHFVSEAGCKEGRYYYHGRCEFDGKVSITIFRQRVFVFARQNIREGKRWVQVTSAPIQDKNIGSWSSFKSVRIHNQSPNTLSLYFMHVQYWNKTHYIGLFPAVALLTGESSGIFASFSSTLYEWSAPILLLELSSKLGRVPIYPAGLYNNELIVYNWSKSYEPLRQLKIFEKLSS